VSQERSALDSGPLIESVRLSGIGPFSKHGPQSEREIPLERLTLFVGPNGSGKTTILRAVRWGCDLLSNPPKTEPRELALQVLPHINASSSVGHLRLELNDESSPVLSVLLTRVNDERAGLVPAIFIDSSTYRAHFAGLSEYEDPQVDEFLREHREDGRWDTRPLSRRRWRANELLLDPDLIAAPSYFDGESPRIESTGEYCASVLVELQLNNAPLFERVKAAVREIIPEFRGMRFKRARSSKDDSPVWGHQLLLDMAGGEEILATAASEGTLIIIGLVTLLVGSEDPPNIVLIDDIDRALHPRAQADLMTLLRRLMNERPELQILATSHSPYLLDHVEPEEVRVTSLDPQSGEAVVASLTEHENFAEWSEMMSPGEFWSAVGEDWVRDIARSDDG